MKDWFFDRLGEASSGVSLGAVISGAIMVWHNTEDAAGWTLLLGGIKGFCTKEAPV
jgi:hypothetical protein